HAAAIFVDQLFYRDAGRRELDARILDPARDREATRALAATAALRTEPRRTLFNDVADPPQGLNIVAQRRPAEETNLRRIGRLVARQAALALDRFEHRRFLAADIGASAAAEMNPRVFR